MLSKMLKAVLKVTAVLSMGGVLLLMWDSRSNFMFGPSVACYLKTHLGYRVYTQTQLKVLFIVSHSGMKGNLLVLAFYGLLGIKKTEK